MYGGNEGRRSDREETELNCASCCDCLLKILMLYLLGRESLCVQVPGLALNTG